VYPVREDIHGHAGNLATGLAEDFRLAISASATVFKSFAESRRALQRQSGGLLGDVFDLNVHVSGRSAEPAQARIGCGPAYLFSSRRVIVPSSMTLPSSSHQQA